MARRKYIYFISLTVLLIFHIVGLYLFLNDPHSSELAWLNMILCAVMLFINAEKYEMEFWMLLGIFIGGYVIEAIGVKTGYLFGNYEYDTALGTKLLSVPLTIGLNWYCIVVISVSLVRRMKADKWLRALSAAAFGTGMDYLIEPVAIHYNFWHWNGTGIPVYSHICWFAFLFIFSLVYLRYTEKRNPLGIPLFIIWFLFFIILNFA